MQEKLVCDEVFIALGSTTKRTPDKQAYYQVDHDYPVLAARLAKEGGAHSVFLVSSVGANAASKANGCSRFVPVTGVSVVVPRLHNAGYERSGPEDPER